MIDGLNLYEYARGNPVKLVDPDGRQSQATEDTMKCTQATRDYESQVVDIQIASNDKPFDRDHGLTHSTLFTLGLHPKSDDAGGGRRLMLTGGLELYTARRQGTTPPTQDAPFGTYVTEGCEFHIDQAA